MQSLSGYSLTRWPEMGSHMSPRRDLFPRVTLPALMLLPGSEVTISPMAPLEVEQ